VKLRRLDSQDEQARPGAGFDNRRPATMSQRTGVPTIRFDATLYTIGEWTILRLPERASGKLPSRGQVAVHGTINGHGFQTVVEPDGYLGHWMKIDRGLLQAAALGSGDTATLEVEPLKDWPEHATRSCGSAGSCPSEDPRAMEGDYPYGALGMGSLGQCNAKP
jgi:hypothetical protein